MTMTRHAHKRMGQRGITLRLINVVREHGVQRGDKLLLGRQNIDDLVQDLDKLRKDLLKVRDKGGIVVVESNETVITTYRLDSYNRQRI
jgi:hypothetical protein